MTNLAGEILELPPLRFNYSSASAVHYDARYGLRTYGPYDSQILGNSEIYCAIIYPEALRQTKDRLVEGLTRGKGRFSGFDKLFRKPLRVAREKPVAEDTDKSMQKAIQSIVADNPELVYIVTSTHNEALYSTVKAELLGNGIPSQVVTAGKLRDDNSLQWTLENIALASYAKIGGTPWVVPSEVKNKELVIGVSRAMDRSGNFVVGHVTMFNQDGDFLFSRTTPQVIAWDRDEYVKGLAGMVTDACAEYSKRYGVPEGIILHLCKRPGRQREVEALAQAVATSGDIPYALIHLNDDGNYRLFDANHATYVPSTGLKVNLGPRNSLLLLDGRKDTGTRNRRGVPNVLDVSMDPRSTMDVEEFPRLVHQVFNFAFVNWRGFNALAIPSTLNYSKLIARMVVEVGIDRWSSIAGAGRLRDKAWFL